MKRASLILGLAFLLVAAGVAILPCKWERCQEWLLYQRPIRCDKQAFHEVVAHCDRIVVRRGGFDCCRGVDHDWVLMTITNKAEVLELAAHLHFAATTTTNSLLESCLCCGFPGIDWYVGRKRVALTAVQHIQNLRWRGFSTARILGTSVAHGDAPLTADSRRWLTNWFERHSLPESERSKSMPRGVGR